VDKDVRLIKLPEKSGMCSYRRGMCLPIFAAPCLRCVS